MSNLEVPNNWIASPLTTTVILDETKWDLKKICHLHFKPHFVGVLTEDVECTFPMFLQDAFVQKFEEENKVAPMGFDKAMVEALGDNTSLIEKGVIFRKGYKINITGIVANLDPEKKGQNGSAERAIVMGVAYGTKMCLPWVASQIWIDWVSINGTNKDLYDITMQQFMDKFLKDRREL